MVFSLFKVFLSDKYKRNFFALAFNNVARKQVFINMDIQSS